MDDEQVRENVTSAGATFWTASEVRDLIARGSRSGVQRQDFTVTGIVLTKLDGTARGGVLVALADRFGLPIHAIGVGEQIDDLAPFDPQDFARALTGADA